MFTQVNQEIQVLVKFAGRRVEPRKFVWAGREIKVAKTNLAYSAWEGRSKVYYFAVSDEANYYKLKFDTDKLTWTLVETYAD